MANLVFSISRSVIEMIFKDWIVVILLFVSGIDIASVAGADSFGSRNFAGAFGSQGKEKVCE